MKESKWRFNARKTFLTYAQCPLSKEVVYGAIHAKYPCKYAMISTELHEDGNTHLHCVFEFQKKVNCRSQAMFDVQGYHPNIQVPKNWPATKNYVKKAGDYEEYNEDPVDEDEDDLYVLAEGMTSRLYFEYCRKKGIQFAYAMQAWRSVGSMFTIDEEYEEDPEAEVCSGLNGLDISGPEYDNKSIVIIGPSGCGKTTIAKRLAVKPALFVTHSDGIKNLHRSHKSIIFDDMSYLHVPREAQIAITDRYEPRQIHVRYGTVSVPAGIQKIFTANQEIFSDDEAVNRRIRKIYSNKF